VAAILTYGYKEQFPGQWNVTRSKIDILRDEICQKYDLGYEVTNTEKGDVFLLVGPHYMATEGSVPLLVELDVPEDIDAHLLAYAKELGISLRYNEPGWYLIADEG